MDDKSLSEKVEIAIMERDKAIAETMELSRECKQKNLEIQNLNENYLRKMIDFYSKRYNEEQEEKSRLQKELADTKVRMDKKRADESRNMEQQMKLLQSKYQSLLADHDKLKKQKEELNTKFIQRGKELEDKLMEVQTVQEHLDQLKVENGRLKQMESKRKDTGSHSYMHDDGMFVTKDINDDEVHNIDIGVEYDEERQ